MSKNLAPIPSRLPQQQGVLGAIGAANPMISAGTGPKTSPLLRYLSTLRRYKWLVLFLVACGYGGGFLMSRLLRPSYIVKANMMVTNPETQTGPISGGPSYSIGQWQEFMLRTKMVEPVVISRRLFITGPKTIGSKPLPPGPSGKDSTLFRNLLTAPDFHGSKNYELSIDGGGKTWTLKDNDVPGLYETGSVGDSIGRKFGFLWNPFVEPAWFGKSFIFEAKTVREAAEDIIGNLRVEPVSRFIHISLTGQDKDLTAATLNDLLQTYVDEAMNEKRKDLLKNSRMYDSTWGEAQSRQKATERALAEFQTRGITQARDAAVVTGGAGVGAGQSQAYDTYINKDVELNNVTRSRSQLDTAFALFKRDTAQVVTLDRFMSIPEVRNSLDLAPQLNELQKLQRDYVLALRKYRPDNPRPIVDTATGMVIDMKARDSIIKNMKAVIVPRAINNQQSLLDDRIRQLMAERNASKVELEKIPNRVIDESSLRRDWEDANKIESVMREYATRARMQLQGVSPDLSIDATAKAPLTPNKNRKSVILGLGIFMGLGAGLALVLLLDLLDKRVRYADQITSGLGLTILGIVPQIRRIQGAQTTPEEDSQVVEAFRTIRLNLAHAASDGKLTLTISSPAPSEGKSLVSSNLALSFAEAGYRTLLIDGDTRRGELHRTFGVDRRPGLIDYLADDHPLADLLRSTSHPLLQLMPSGSRKRNAPELLGSLKMRDLLQMYKEKYDIVIVDSPPLGAGIDPFVLGTLTGSLMLVVRAGATQKDLAEAKLQVIDQLPIRLVGAVLNYVSSTTPLYRYYSYTSGYAAVDEDAAPASLPPTKVEVKKVDD